MVGRLKRVKKNNLIRMIVRERNLKEGKRVKEEMMKVDLVI